MDRVTPKRPKPPPVLLDDPAVKAMIDWDNRGRPEAEIGLDQDAPTLTEEQLRQMQPASFVIGRRRKG